MAVDFAHPTLTDLYSSGTGTDWPGYLQDNIAAAAMWLEGLDPPGKRVGFKRINAGVFQQWNGTAWVAMPMTFAAATLGDPLAISAATISLPNNAVTWQAPSALIYSEWKSTTAGAADYAELRVTSNDVIGRWVAYHSAHGSRPNQVWLQAFSANSSLVLGQNGTEHLRLMAGMATVTGQFSVFSDNTNRFRVSGSGGTLYFDSLNAASSAWLPSINRSASHRWVINSATDAMFLTSAGLSVSPNGAQYTNSRVTIIPAANATTFADAKTLCIGEASASVDYRLQLGMAYVGVWTSAIQSWTGTIPGPLYLNPQGGNVAIGHPTSAPGNLILALNNASTGGRDLIFENAGPVASHTNVYTVGAIWAQGWRDLYGGGAMLGGIQFQRSPTNGGLSSALNIIFRADFVGAATGVGTAERMRLNGFSGGLEVGITPSIVEIPQIMAGELTANIGLGVRSNRADGPAGYRGHSTTLLGGYGANGSAGYSVAILMLHNAYHNLAGELGFIVTSDTNVRREALRLHQDGSATFYGAVNLPSIKTNRTWQTVSRAGNTDYVAPNYDIEVALTATTSANSSYIGIRVNGTVIVQAGNAGATNTILTLEGVTIPAGATYQYVAVGGISFNLVCELR